MQLLQVHFFSFDSLPNGRDALPKFLKYVFLNDCIQSFCRYSAQIQMLNKIKAFLHILFSDARFYLIIQTHHRQIQYHDL